MRQSGLFHRVIERRPGPVGAHEAHVGRRPARPDERGFDRADEATPLGIGPRHVLRVGRRAVPGETREDQRSAPSRVLLLLEEEKTCPFAQGETVPRDVERPRGCHAERAQRVEAREDEGRDGVGSAGENEVRVSAPNPLRPEAERGGTRRAGDGDRGNGPPCTLPRREVARERAGFGAGQAFGSRDPRRQPLREGSVAGEGRPNGNSRTRASERRVFSARAERFIRRVAREQSLAFRSFVFPFVQGADQGRVARVEAPGVEPRDGPNRRPPGQRALPESSHPPPESGSSSHPRHDHPRRDPHVVSIIAPRAPRAAPSAQKAHFRLHMKIVIASDAKQPNEIYRGALLAAGALPEEVVVVLPGDADPGAFDGLLLAGGTDVDPTRYGETPKVTALELHPERDNLDFALLSAAEKLQAPVFGICRGLQVVNVALGGTLWQDLPTQRSRGLPHDTDADPPCAHAIRTRPGGSRSRFAAAIAALEGAPVNSRHHQGLKELAPGLAALAASPDDLVEAFERPGDGFFAAVQWHPENLVAERKQKALFEAFLDACRAQARATGRAGGPLVFVSLEGPLAVVKLARPAAGNAFAGDMVEMLADTVAALAADPTVPAIILTGLGDAFSRGLDPELLAALLALGDEEGFAAHLDALGHAARTLAAAPRPILAAVDGAALGAGFGIALACDQRVASATPPHETVLALSPVFPALGAGASFFLPTLASFAAAADLTFSGEALGAARARELGIVDVVAEDGSALPLALRRAAQYAERPTASLAAAKRAFASTERLQRLEDGLAREKDFALTLFRDGTLFSLASLASHTASGSFGFGSPPSIGGNDRPQ
jgi:putative glutamine amidotransferase